MNKFIGQRLWFLDGSVHTCPPKKFSSLSMPEDGLLVRMKYFEDDTKEIQQNDWYYEAPHHSGESIRGSCSDKDYEENLERYPTAVWIRGQWGPDDYYRKVVDEAMASTWKDGS